MDNFRCKKCDNVSTADSINETTINNCCINRQQRRNFVPIEKASQTNRKWYQCPSCGANMWQNGFERIKEAK